MSRVYTLSRTITLEVIECAHCGAPFGVSQYMLDQRRQTGLAFYCPDGHANVFNGELDQLRKDLARKTHELDQAQAAAADEFRLRKIAERRHAATKGELTKVRQRVAGGACPCCHRHFTNLERHMRGQHPDFAAPESQEHP